MIYSTETTRSLLAPALLVLAACSGPAPAPAPAPRPDLATVAAPDLAPAISTVEPAGWVGSARCRECHAKKHERWSRDWHARALATASPTAVVGNWAGTHYRGSSTEAWMRREAGRFTVRTAGPGGALGDFPVRWVLGGKRMQDSITELPDGRWQVLPVYFHVTGRGAWVDYTEAKQGALAPDHPFFWANFRRNANHECLDCHVTGLDTRYRRATGRWTTSFVEAGVGCESCHGPGARHSASRDPADIVHPGDAPPAVSLAICGSCHGPRSPIFPLLDARHRFRPGDRYADRYLPLGLVDGASRSGDFFADGRPKASSFEYQALLQSRCHRVGGLTCLGCHSAPHEARRAAELPDDPDQGCRRCHAALFARLDEHTHHRAAAARRCVACHMPSTVTGVLDRFADHALDIPNPNNAARHGVPDACTACHTRSTPSAMATALLRLWPEAAARTRRRTRLADAFDELTASGSRAALEQVIADAEEAPTLRATAAMLLAQRFPQAAPALAPLLSHPDPLLRTRALEALGMAGAHAACDRIVALGADPVLSVRHAAALVLSMLGDPRADAALAAVAADPDGDALPQPHFLLGLSAARRGEFELAEREVDRALDRLPYFADGLVARADLHARREEWPEVRARLEEALRFQPRHRGALERLPNVPGP